MRPSVARALARTLFLASILALGAAASGGAQTGGQPKPTIKEATLAIPAGQKVEVRLRNKEKVVGRMGAVTNDTVEVQVAAHGMVETRKLDFSEIKSIKAKGHPPTSPSH